MSLKNSATTLVENARARIEGIETSEAINMMNDPDVIIVDIRDIRERQRSGYIPGSFHAPRGMIELGSILIARYLKRLVENLIKKNSTAPLAGALL